MTWATDTGAHDHRAGERTTARRPVRVGAPDRSAVAPAGRAGRSRKEGPATAGGGSTVAGPDGPRPDRRGPYLW
ncbi:hypothetical protein [Polymorphospora sp. NPDC050346]|uniref:hypothetical protein n=1 Tax=Polymorphospora sp. NPDC050346 TaxID=3155780 RepID=UPI0033CBE432